MSMEVSSLEVDMVLLKSSGNGGYTGRPPTCCETHSLGNVSNSLSAGASKLLHGAVHPGKCFTSGIILINLTEESQSPFEQPLEGERAFQD
ncbi:hypothetical protein K466DRAFT_588630 [Polyporus arcularius HHB13444]|uniref:Uncharacterized protein n=1 Tax=Polyporus arcularius HHB13444 TaxID=1314778 RepID=A0A5C3P552_9APHY|nr:hypothetical protein K466DRAFT_588630 [Polyporus arcularius HHB13444]